MTLDPSIEEAHLSPEPASHLRLLAKGLLARGVSHETVLALFEDSRQALRETGRESDEDAVMDVMDCLVGWCSPHMKLEAVDARANGNNGPPNGGRPMPQVSPIDRGMAGAE